VSYPDYKQLIWKNMWTSIRGFLWCDTVQCCGKIQTFRSILLPPSSGWFFLRDAGRT